MLEPETIRNKTFRTVKNGYDTAEVSSFLNDIANELEGLIAENAKLEEQNKMLYDKVMEYRDQEADITKERLTAKRDAKKTIDEAKAKARDMIESAKVMYIVSSDHLRVIFMQPFSSSGVTDSPFIRKLLIPLHHTGTRRERVNSETSELWIENFNDQRDFSPPLWSSKNT